MWEKAPEAEAEAEPEAEAAAKEEGGGAAAAAEPDERGRGEVEKGVPPGGGLVAAGVAMVGGGSRGTSTARIDLFFLFFKVKEKVGLF